MLARIVFGVILLAASALLLWRVFLFTGAQPGASGDANEGSKPAGEPYAERDWNTERPGSLNISLYTFRDQNRNGRYDLGDLPMAGVVVDLTRPDGSVAQALSNINGYTNFKMSFSDPDQPITQPHQIYRFEVQAPPGWRVSSGNQEQEIQFLPLPGSVAGLIAEPAPNWVGLVPELSIRGRLVAAGEASPPQDLKVVLIDPQGQSRNIEVSDDGAFQSSASPGRWVLWVESNTPAWSLRREIIVDTAPVELMNIAVGEELPAPLVVTVVEDFDWLQRSVIDKIPNGHLGLDWDYLLAVDNQQYNGPGYVNGLISGHAVAYNSSGHPVTISAVPGELFDFAGGYFSVAWPQAQGEVLDIVAWRNDVEVARHELKLSYLGPVWLDADVRAIDRLTLSTRHYWQFVADDLKFRLMPAPRE